MTGLSKTAHPLRIFAGSANRPLAEQVARRLDVELGKCTTTLRAVHQRDAPADVAVEITCADCLCG
jgi:hypothetical protein